MKTCIICNKPIINGINGCAMYDTCSDCKPINYISKASPAKNDSDYENLILSRQEND